MSFSRLLLVAVHSRKCIEGEGNDKVCISPKVSVAGRDAYEGEVALCFQLDDRNDREKRVSHSLGIAKDKRRCDGLVFYAQDGKPERVICLVEMKSTNIKDAANQIISTKVHIEKLLREECNSLPEEYRSDCRKQLGPIRWKACLYHHGGSPERVGDIQKALKDSGFIDIDILTSANNDLRPLLSGEGRSAKEMAKKYKGGRKR